MISYFARAKGYQMKAVHGFFGKATLVTGLLLFGYFLTDQVSLSFPLWVKNYTFAIFGISLAVFAFTFKRWREDDVE